MEEYTVTFSTSFSVALYVVVCAYSFGDAVSRSWIILEKEVSNTVGYYPVQVTLHPNSNILAENLCDNQETQNVN